ncbi:exodeoxyribonuclease III [Ottowia pentelensis]|uniref:exodeoxyribonuclease III n=1 Tax=Ottowia pentelensis TaxID=511108 RepID=UPI00363630B2
MKIATWNVNSLTARLQHVLDWLAVNPVDVLALQELKLSDDKFPHEALRAAGYEAAVFGQKTYNGVALLTRAPLLAADVARNIAGFADDNARLIAATLEAPGGPLRLVNGYFVNGQAPGSDKFDYKMSWLRALRDHLREELAAHPRLLLVGDFNIVPEDRDSYDPVAWPAPSCTPTRSAATSRRCWGWAWSIRFACSSSPTRAFRGGTTACWATRRTAACASTTCWSAPAGGAGARLQHRPHAAQMAQAQRPCAGDRDAGLVLI